VVVDGWQKQSSPLQVAWERNWAWLSGRRRWWWSRSRGLGRGNDQEHPDFQSRNRLGAITVAQKVSLAWEGLGTPSTGRIVPPRRLKFFDGGARDGDSETRSAGVSTGQHARGSCAMMLVLLCLVDIWHNTYFSAMRSIEVSS
jgi:hypothetical protein